MNDNTKDHVFISYSHNDDISRILEWFDKNNYNFVFDDSEFCAGEEWERKARKCIRNPKCKGVITMISASSLSSSAVLKEVEFTKLFNKESICISLENCSLEESVDKIKNDNDKNNAEEILSYFPIEKIFVKRDDLLNGNDNNLKRAFENWGFLPNSNDEKIENVEMAQYTSEIAGEKTRLTSQQRGYYSFDMSAIESIVAKFPEGQKLTILDLGCSNGEVASSRFADDRFEKVIGVDYNQKDVDEANGREYDDKFSFFCIDLESENFLDELRDKLNSVNVKNVDIVFMALTLHHLKNPKMFLLRLFEIFDDKMGYIMIRSSDDGGKLCYPNNELMQEFLRRYDNLVQGTTDRCNGRKLYSLLCDAGYCNISMMYRTTDTCEKNRQAKSSSYNTGFSFRESRLKEIKDKNRDNAKIQEEVDWQLNALNSIKEMFMQRNFWYSNTSYIAIASIY